MATKTFQKPARYDGAISRLLYYPEAASQSFKVGQAVYLNSGALTVCADNATVILGFAAADASGVTGAACPVDVIGNSDLIVLTAYSTTNPTTASTVADSIIGTSAAGIKIVNGMTVADVTQSNKSLRFIGRMPGDAATDIYPKVICKIISADCQSDVA